MRVLIFINDMNTKYEKYINYIVNELEPPYFKNMRENYGLRNDEFNLVLSRLYNRPVDFVANKYVYDRQTNMLYYEEHNDGDWIKREYDENDREIYWEDSNGDWHKKEYDKQGNEVYKESSTGYWIRRKYDEQGEQISVEDSFGNIRHIG